MAEITCCLKSRLLSFAFHSPSPHFYLDNHDSDYFLLIDYTQTTIVFCKVSLSSFLISPVPLEKVSTRPRPFWSNIPLIANSFLSMASQSVPSTPKLVAVPTPMPDESRTPGKWRHPQLNEIVKRQNAATFGDRNMKSLVWNTLALVMTSIFGNTLNA